MALLTVDCKLTKTLSPLTSASFPPNSFTILKPPSQTRGLYSSRQTESPVSEVLQTGAGGEEAGRLRGPLCHQPVPVSTCNKNLNFKQLK